MLPPALSHFLCVSQSDLNRYSQRSIYFSRPQKLCLYSVIDGKILPSKNLQYFREPKLTEYPIDLNGAFPTFRFFRMTNKTRALLSVHHEITNHEVKKIHSEQTATNDDEIDHTTVYTRSGTLRSIMQFCYSKGFDFNIHICRHNGKLYLFEYEQETLQASDMTPVHTHHSRLCRQVFTDYPNSLPNLDAPYTDYEPQQLLFRSSLGKYDMFYAGEVNGIISDTKFDKMYGTTLGNTVPIILHIHTYYNLRKLWLGGSMKIVGSKNEALSDDVNALNKQRFVSAKQMWGTTKNKHFKMLNYWVQAYLSNIDDIYLGYKDSNSIIQKPIQHFEVSKIPKGRFWKPGVCTAFLNEFLERVEKLMWNVDSFETVYEFHFKPKENNTIYYEIHQGNMEKVFIPKEYIDFVKNRNSF